LAQEIAAMDTIPLSEAKEHLEDLIARAARGEDVRISDPVHGTARIVVEPTAAPALHPKRVPGRWKGRIHIPEDRLLEPLSDAELSWLSGETST
jgi:prevent-host-death family protein